MKINFGKYKNKNIETPKNSLMRPTTAIAKSIIFNTLDVEDFKLALDVFAGTGSLGLEALSLGIEKVIFCDKNSNSTKSIRSTLNKIEIERNRYEVINGDFRQVIKSSHFENYDLIFLDPPFSVSKYFEISLELIFNKKKLSSDGIIVLEIPSKLKVNALEYFRVWKEKTIGDKIIYFLKNK